MDLTPFPSGLLIRRIVVDQQEVILEADGYAPSGRCPSCGMVSAAVHDRYQRRPLDLPWRGHTGRLVVTVRRFRCRNAECPRATFAEDFGTTLPHRAPRTTAADHLLLRFACVAGGEAGARLARASGLPISADTLLRLLRRTDARTSPTPRVLGVDDLALRRGHTYATILVDMETHRPLDLLAGRDAAVLATWLRDHPGVAVVVRDRAEAYAEGARVGAPDAQQVADRFHLVKNASDALDDLLRSRRRRIDIVTSALDETAATVPLPPAAVAEERPLSRTQQQQRTRRAARVLRWERVHALHAQGVSLRRIAEEVGIDRRTVRRLAATPAPPINHMRQPRPGGLTSPTLQPYVSYLQDRWQQGCHNVSRLYRELVRQGYPGSRSLLAQALQPWRPPRPPPQQRPRTRRLNLRWLCLRPPDQLDADEQAALQHALAEDAELATGYALLQRFRALIAARDVDALGAWLADAHASGLPSFGVLANGLAADRLAVEAALATPWSNGLVEGHVHRVKLIKRQGYGRAKLDLLRRRVLAA